MANATMAATVMVVEDDAAVRELLVLALEANAFETAAAGNIRDALAFLRSRRVDLLLLDLGLGAETGIDLLKVIRQMPEYEKLPVILLTGRADRNTVLEIAQLGVQGYVLKHQFSRKDLIERINQQLAREPAIPAPVIANGENKLAAAARPEARATQFDLLRSVKPVVTRAQTLEQVDRCAELKALSPTVAQLMSVTAAPDSSFEQIARLINMDQAIALKILKIANSVQYGCERSIDTVHQALSRIGVSQVRQLVLSMAVIENFHTRSLGEQFNGEMFWEHAIATGLIAASITRSREGEKGAVDFAFTVGLLHDVARMVFVERLDDIYKRVLDTAAHLQLPLEQVESRMLLINHAEVVDRLLSTWNFPRRLVETIAMHHLSDEKILALSPQKCAAVATLALANRLAHAMLLGSSGNNCQYPTGALAKILELKPEAIKSIEQQIPQQTADLKSAMFERTDAAPRLDFRQRLLKKIHRPVQTLYVSANPAVDGHRLLLEQLGEPSGNGRLNMAAVYLSDMKERDALFAKLREQEKANCVRPLPLIVISPIVNLKLDPKLVGDRECRIVPSPFTLARLADTVNSLLLLDA